jgi:SAM-dependent methyltransferase
VTAPGRRWLFPALVMLRDTLVLDRWRWIGARLPFCRGARLLDVGCAAGAFTIGAALRGYEAWGLDHDPESLEKADRRARWLGVTARFIQGDVRRLADRLEWAGTFDVVLCCETIEHVLDDASLARGLAICLKPGGRLLLTTPFVGFRAITAGDDGRCSAVEDGGHVRRGYAPDGLRALLEGAGFETVEISWCSGFLSQKATAVYRLAGGRCPVLGWLAVLPLRPWPPLLDGVVTRALRWPWYTICAEAKRTALV